MQAVQPLSNLLAMQRLCGGLLRCAAEMLAHIGLPPHRCQVVGGVEWRVVKCRAGGG